jgi:crotonobetainyl-CoA:carnitine CoA-transferase CaiB-like acyl-CoA transferase
MSGPLTSVKVIEIAGIGPALFRAALDRAAAMVDGTVALLGMMFGMRAESYFRDATGENVFAGDVPFYGTYETKDGRYVAIGSLEPQFYALLLEKLGLGEQFAGLGIETVDDPKARERNRAPDTPTAAGNDGDLAGQQNIGRIHGLLRA